MRRFNALAPEFDLSSEREGYRWSGPRIRQGVRPEQISVCLYELEDGQRSYRYHFHHGINGEI